MAGLTAFFAGALVFVSTAEAFLGIGAAAFLDAGLGFVGTFFKAAGGARLVVDPGFFWVVGRLGTPGFFVVDVEAFPVAAWGARFDPRILFAGLLLGAAFETGAFFTPGTRLATGEFRVPFEAEVFAAGPRLREAAFGAAVRFEARAFFATTLWGFLGAIGCPSFPFLVVAAVFF